jgi:hypothetical protein
MLKFLAALKLALLGSAPMCGQNLLICGAYDA